MHCAIARFLFVNITVKFLVPNEAIEKCRVETPQGCSTTVQTSVEPQAFTLHVFSFGECDNERLPRCVLVNYLAVLQGIIAFCIIK